MDHWLILLLFITGLLSGFYSGMIGSGGNVILIPVLDFVLFNAGLKDDILVKSIIAHSLMVTFFLGCIVAYRQYKAGNFFAKEVLLTSVVGIVTAIVATWLIRNGDWYNKEDFDIVFSFMLFLLILKLFTDKTSGLTGMYERSSAPLLLGIGGLTGVVTSLSGLGGGILLIPGFTDIMRMSLKKASSVSISVIAVLALPISLSYLAEVPNKAATLPFQVGLISFTVVVPTLLGVLISAPFGVKTAHRIHPRTIRIIFAIVVSSLLVKMIYTMS